VGFFRLDAQSLERQRIKRTLSGRFVSDKQAI
jgi:hypothetical protein